jgi:hypothetical protein
MLLHVLTSRTRIDGNHARHLNPAVCSVPGDDSRLTFSARRLRVTVFLSEPWPVLPWLFVPEAHIPLLETKLKKIANGQPPLFNPKITALETVQPWLYRSWNQEPY